MNKLTEQEQIDIVIKFNNEYSKRIVHNIFKDKKTLEEAIAEASAYYIIKSDEYNGMNMLNALKVSNEIATKLLHGISHKGNRIE